MNTATPSLRSVSAPVPVRAGAGLKAPHYQEILEELPDIGWFEVHPENYMGRGGAPLRYLEKIRQHYPISLHSVGTSLGSHRPFGSRPLASHEAISGSLLNQDWFQSISLGATATSGTPTILCHWSIPKRHWIKW